MFNCPEIFTTFKNAIQRANYCHLRKIPFFIMVDYEMQRAVFLQESDFFKYANFVKFRFGNFTNAVATTPKLLNATLKVVPPNKAAYFAKFEKLQNNIRRGNSFLANLTEKTEVVLNASFSDVFYSAKSEYAVCLGEDFVCFSPECFVKIKGGKIYSYPMKGTINADIADAENILLNDQKELQEHNTIVDLIRNDLALVADSVRVNRFRFVTRIKRANKSDIIQTSSEISGTLKNILIGDILKNILPAGSISGAPKPKTVEILRECEGEKRGFYTGIFGYFDSENFDSAVAIRCMEKSGGKTYYKSGGGITYLSDANSEYAEIVEKIYIPLKPKFIETIKVKDGVADFALNEKRYLKTLRDFYPEATPENFSEIVKTNARLGCNGTYKLRIEYSDKIEKVEIAKYTPKKIDSLKVVDCGDIDYSYKFADRSRLNELAAKKGECQDVIICKNDFVCDSSYANLVFEKSGKLYTPKTCLLNGTKRAKLVAEKKVMEIEIRKGDIKNFDNVYFVNAMLDIADNVKIPVKNIFF